MHSQRRVAIAGLEGVTERMRQCDTGKKRNHLERDTSLRDLAMTQEKLVRPWLTGHWE